MNTRRYVALATVAALLAGCFGGGSITPVRTAFNRAVYLYSVGDYDQAIDEYRLALDENSRDYRARFNLAVALESRANEYAAAGRQDQAIRMRSLAELEYRTVVEQGTGNVRAAINLAAMEFERGDRDAARVRLQELRDQFPDATMVHTALAAQLLASAATSEAIEVLEAAVARSPSNLAANRLLGDAYSKVNDPLRARAAYDEALRRDGDDLGTLLARARLELGVGNHQEASIWLSRLLLIDPDNCDGHVMQSQAMENLGQLEDAAMHLWRARRSPQFSQDPEEVERRLQGLYRRLIDASAEKK